MSEAINNIQRMTQATHMYFLHNNWIRVDNIVKNVHVNFTSYNLYNS